MNLPLINLAILIATSAVLSLAMWFAWFYLGRARYAQLWAIAAAGSTLQWSFSALCKITIPDAKWPFLIAGMLVLTDSALVAIGARHRGRLRLHLPWFLASGLLAAAAMVYAFFHVNLPVRGFVANAFSAVMMGIAAAALLPRRRMPTAPEAAIAAAFILFALFQSWLALLSIGIGARGEAAGIQIYRNVLTIGLPAIYSTVGMAGVFVLAMDLNDRLRAVTTRDPLTGVLNRRGLEQAATAAFADARRHGRALAVALCAIDGFEQTRAKLSFAEVDDVIRTTTDLVQASVREEDVVARTGLAEICVLLIGADRSEAARLMRRAGADLAAVSTGIANLPSIVLSVGVCDFVESDVLINDVLARADGALRAAQANGGGQIMDWNDLPR